jgi:diketogulonate reductase-like aldo/keto reductase
VQDNVAVAQTLKAAYDAGKVKTFGISNFHTW